MRVGLVLQTFDPGKGGLENWTWQFAERLALERLEVHVIAEQVADIVLPERVRIHRVHPSGSPLKRAAAFSAAIQRLGLDIVHDMGHGFDADLFHPHGGSSLAHFHHNLLRIPKWRRVTFWREKRYREFRQVERKQHGRPESRFIAVSNMVKRHLVELNGIAADRIDVIYNGVDLVRFSPERRLDVRQLGRELLGVKPDEIVYLMLAHNLPLKNAASLIEAAALLKGVKAKVVIAGSDRNTRFRRLAVRAGVEERVMFLGPQADVMPLYGACDVYVQPTWYDPCSLVTLEALACGLPVITTRFNGASELMSDGENGYVLEKPDDAEMLAGSMTDLAEQGRRERVGKAARVLAERHSFEKQIGGILEIYRRIHDGKSKRS